MKLIRIEPATNALLDWVEDLSKIILTKAAYIRALRKKDKVVSKINNQQVELSQ